MANAVAWLFGKSVFGESDEFLEYLLGSCQIDALRERALAKLGPETDHRLTRSLAGHGAAELVGLTGAEARQRHRHAEHLLLVEDDTQAFPAAPVPAGDGRRPAGGASRVRASSRCWT